MSSSTTVSKNTTNSDWLNCVDWLNKLNCLPIQLKQRFLSNQLQLSEFANSLRDGELLCTLANRLIPGCIDLSLINKRSQMSQLLCLNNIRLFLNVCKSKQYFNLNDEDLFDEHMLYDLVDLACVMRTLSIISKSKIATKILNQGFSSSIDSNKENKDNFFKNKPNSQDNHSQNNNIRQQQQQNQNNQHIQQQHQIENSSDDIYYNILPTEFESPESYYTDESFLFNGLIDQQNQTDNSAYQFIVQSSQQHQPLKRDFVIREILNTEENFLDGLNTLSNDFLIPLSRILNEQDRKLICINIDKLIKLHKSLYDQLFNACKGGQGRTQRICNVFENFKLDLMKEYAEYFSTIDRSIAKCDSLSQCNLNNDQYKQQYLIDFRNKLDECRKLSKRGNFKLTDLLRLPYQRVLKYHLLFNELLKQTDVEHSAKDLIKQTRDSMCELGNYLNECQRDKENLSHIEQLLRHLPNSVDSNNGNTNRLSGSIQSVYSSSGFNFNLLKDYGHYIKDDKFRIKSVDLGERSARTRTFFLFEKALIVCKLKGNYYNYKETFLINEYQIEDPQSNLTSSISSNLPAASGGLLSTLFNDLTTSNNLLNNSLSGINNSLSSSSINLNSNQHALYLISTDRSKINLIIFKNKEQKKIWKQSLIQARDKVRPAGQRNNKHIFELTNFERDLVKCFVCSKYLLGLFYQGYKCGACSSIAHKDCLTKINVTCCATNFQQNTVTPFSTTMLVNAIGNKLISGCSLSHSVQTTTPKPTVTLERSLSNVSNSSKQTTNVNYCARAWLKYDGRPVPPETPILLFNQGDLIQVTDDDDDEWWKGFILSASKMTRDEGYFPRRHVKILPTQTKQNNQPSSSSTPPLNVNLEECAWFAPVDRLTADTILSRIPNPETVTLFMVRCRQEGGYAISIKYKGIVDHIKINVNFINDPVLLNESNNESNLQCAIQPVYSIDQQHNFSSILSLVSYYSQNILKDNFPQLDTTLGIAYREALPPPIGFASAMHDYNPIINPNNTGEQIELKKLNKYFILNKEINGWWRVFNQDGLIGYVPGSYLLEKSLTEA